jgi:hypothetical protein
VVTTQEKPAQAQRFGRWPRRLGLGLIAFGTIWTVAMAISAKWWWGYCGRGWVVDIGDGTLYVTDSRQLTVFEKPLLGWYGGVNYATNGTDRAWMWTWWTWGRFEFPRSNEMAFSIWPLAPLSLASGALILYWPSIHARRRRRQNQCVKCGYSRDGLADGAPCPECGD